MPIDRAQPSPGIAFAGVAKYPARVKCALLGWTAFKAALAEASAKDTVLAAVGTNAEGKR